MQEEARKEMAESSVGGGMVKVTANGAGEVLSITISPDAIDPSDPEALADLVLAGVNEALRSASAADRGEGAGDAVGAARRPWLPGPGRLEGSDPVQALAKSKAQPQTTSPVRARKRTPRPSWKRPRRPRTRHRSPGRRGCPQWTATLRKC